MIKVFIYAGNVGIAAGVKTSSKPSLIIDNQVAI